jgi:hypothetical protein
VKNKGKDKNKAKVTKSDAASDSEAEDDAEGEVGGKRKRPPVDTTELEADQNASHKIRNKGLKVPATKLNGWMAGIIVRVGLHVRR